MNLMEELGECFWRAFACARQAKWRAHVSASNSASSCLCACVTINIVILPWLALQRDDGRGRPVRKGSAFFKRPRQHRGGEKK